QQAPAQQPRLRGLEGPARARGADPAGDGGVRRLPGGRARVPGEARPEFPRCLGRRGLARRTAISIPPALAPSRTVRRALTLAVAVLAAMGLLAGTAFAGSITPQSGGSPNADDIAGLYKLVLVVAIIVLVGVEGTLLYTIIRFRKKKGAVPAQI